MPVAGRNANNIQSVYVYVYIYICLLKDDHVAWDYLG